jgi:hypothetical protein
MHVGSVKPGAAGGEFANCHSKLASEDRDLSTAPQRITQEAAGQTKSFGINAVTQPRPHVPFDGNSSGRKRFARHVQRLERN